MVSMMKVLSAQETVNRKQSELYQTKPCEQLKDESLFI